MTDQNKNLIIYCFTYEKCEVKKEAGIILLLSNYPSISL